MGFVFERLWAFIFCAGMSSRPPWVKWALDGGILWAEQAPPYCYQDSVSALVARGIPAEQIQGGSIPEVSLAYLVNRVRAQLPPGPLRVLHIGNFVGLSLCYLANAISKLDPKSLIVAIDPDLVHRNVINPQSHVAFLLSRYRLQSQVLLIAGYSLEKCVSNDGVTFGYDPKMNFPHEAGPEGQLPLLYSLTGPAFDLALVDGNHDLGYLAREIEAIDKLLKPGGILAIDDVTDGWPRIRELYRNLGATIYRDLGTDGRVGLLHKS